MQGTRRAGWSQREANLLWETADEAQQQGLPLKSVFESIARQTGRRPNSIRNYYYAQVQKREGGPERVARFVPFEEDEVRGLMETVLRARARGQSVRSCLSGMAGGEHRTMLRLQNKYRSVLKTRPELVASLVEKLQGEGLQARLPEVKARPRVSIEGAVSDMNEAARGDPALVAACETLTRLMLSRSEAPKSQLSVRLDLYRMALDEKHRALESLVERAETFIAPVKEYAANPAPDTLAPFLETLKDAIGPLEASLQEARRAGDGFGG